MKAINDDRLHVSNYLSGYRATFAAELHLRQKKGYGVSQYVDDSRAQLLNSLSLPLASFRRRSDGRVGVANLFSLLSHRPLK